MNCGSLIYSTTTGIRLLIILITDNNFEQFLKYEPKSEFLNLSTINILGLIILCCGVLSCRALQDF